MQKPLIVPLALVIILTGCSGFKKSQTWQRVVDHRSDRLASSKSTYADRLHAVLESEHVEHKIVTYQFRYRTRLREEAVGAGTAVIYRDRATPSSPWWVSDENSPFPVWVPDGNPDRQVSFFLRHRADVLEQRDFSADGGKTFNTAPALAAPDSAPLMLAKARKPEPKRIAATRPTAPVDFIRPDRDLGAIFRTTHGTRFDPDSSADRQKMVELQQFDSSSSSSS